MIENRESRKSYSLLLKQKTKGGDLEMVKVSIEVSNEAATFGVAVQARSIERALSLVQQRYPEGVARVKFPIEPEGFFAEDRTARARLGGSEAPQRMAA
jgi:hypothetical protein